jgi:hypothetical protein
MDCRCSLRSGLLMYCCGICGLGGISGGGETTELRDAPKLSTLGLLLRVVPLGFGLSMLGLSMLGLSVLDLSILDRGSAIGEGWVALDVADFQPFRIDLRAASFSFSGKRTLAGGMGGRGIFEGGRSENRELGDGRLKAEFG